ncbi:hypothetical protein NUW58_g2814 [Xylaria curta]|uniref:Uncharacterized protein n=1 Tax=Xylaria curta TaxID=42375 RepID=A0ACC1PGG8_9PEZI|nr:hypothetical protein NUW58_g2814 [Xylaria curta]
MPPIISPIDVIMESVVIGVLIVVGVYGFASWIFILTSFGNQSDRLQSRYLFMAAISTAVPLVMGLTESREFLRQALNQPFGGTSARA